MVEESGKVTGYKYYFYDFEKGEWDEENAKFIKRRD